MRLLDFMKTPEGWGRAQGREVFQALVDYVDSETRTDIFRVSVDGVRRIDISFAAETIVELAYRYRCKKGFCFVDLTSPDMIENWDAAASRRDQPLMVWQGKKGRVIGAQPSQGTLEAFQFALDRDQVRAAEFSSALPNMSIANASNKFKQLWEKGFLLRREDAAGSGGVEYTYFRIK